MFSIGNPISSVDITTHAMDAFGNNAVDVTVKFSVYGPPEKAQWVLEKLKDLCNQEVFTNPHVPAVGPTSFSGPTKIVNPIIDKERGTVMLSIEMFDELLTKSMVKSINAPKPKHRLKVKIKDETKTEQGVVA